MAEFKIKVDNALTAEEVNELQAKFRVIEGKVQRANELQSSAREYFTTLESIARNLHDLRKNVDDFTIDGDKLYVSEWDYNNLTTAAYAFGFWLPSSVGC